MNQSWNPENIEQLRQLWAEGLSAAKIAAKLGDGITRNAVIGKVQRLKLPGRKKDASPTESSRGHNGKAPHIKKSERRKTIHPGNIVRRRNSRKYDPGLKERPVDMAAPDPLNLDLMDLTTTTCRWPIGHPRQSDFSFCGHECPAEDPYCLYHSALAYRDLSSAHPLLRNAAK